MRKRATLELKDLGDLAGIIPGPEPELRVSIRTIPASQDALAKSIVPVCEPLLGGNEREYVLDCIDSNWISSQGKYINLFEEVFSSRCGAKYGVACANGTVALHLALATLGVGPGDEVIIPTFTMIATANAVSYTGATPVLVDAEPETFNMDPAEVEKKITPKTKALMPVHIYGHPAEMDRILEVAREHSLHVIQDAAEAHGAEYRGRAIGGMGDAACYSFYANKIITTGEGGMITTNNEELATLAANLRDHAFSKGRHFWHEYLGFNYRMTNLQAAVGLAQTERFSELVEARRRHASIYTALLKDIPGIRTPVEKSWAKNVYWMYAILVEDDYGRSRDELRWFLAEQGIETRAFFIPIHLQPIYHQTYRGQRYPVAEELCRKGLYLPSASSLSEEQISRVAGAVAACRAGRT